MGLQTNPGKTRRTKAEASDTPVKKITMPKKAVANTAATAKTSTAAAAAPTKKAATSRKAATGTSARTATEKAPAKKVAFKKLKRGTEGSYKTRGGIIKQAKVSSYNDTPNGVWLEVKNMDGSANTSIRPSAFTPAAA